MNKIEIKSKNKKGITVASLIVYVVLFFLFTSVVVMISSNINNKIFSDRANINNYKNSAKAMTYVLNSAKNSKDATEIDERLVFSNNDEYVYKNNTLYKNDKVILRDITNFEYSITDISNNKKNVNVTFRFKKYTKELEKTYNFIVGGGVYE